ncbi:site-specific recombinase XerD [Belliella baltica DSM 15883]|uniref:Site-specific recombinase XerD n=1 Tax=Belliella baltica (strain DSM 15883 / CIP 108006 / LMG 21964 / BA134) TaxID=866536 RepID=I3Z5H4_BELBD|nr:transposase [Belliella baltica]AFL84492.1 site-specific recombinase XerD [Belliella baltica DSM 15883]
MFEEMSYRHYSPRSIKTYIGLVSIVSKYFGKSPDLISIAELKHYLFTRIEQDKLSASSVNQTISGFKILFKDVLGREWDPVKIKRPRRPKILPTVFSKEEISQILNSIRNRKHYCLIALAYGSGLRLGEVISLKPSDIDSDGMQWIHANKKFFVPIKALSAIFRGVFMERLIGAIQSKELKIPKSQDVLYGDIKSIKSKAYEKPWNVYVKKTFKGANQVVSYLGRYTHRVAISNSRILATDGHTVRFQWKDYRDNKSKTLTLDCAEFVRRFMQHILPSGFYKIRYYGIMASTNSATKMDECFRLLKKPRLISFYQGLSTYEVLREIFGDEMFKCPCCKSGKMVFGIREEKGEAP